MRGFPTMAKKNKSKIN